MDRTRVLRVRGECVCVGVGKGEEQASSLASSTVLRERTWREEEGEVGGATSEAVAAPACMLILLERACAEEEEEEEGEGEAEAGPGGGGSVSLSSSSLAGRARSK